MEEYLMKVPGKCLIISMAKFSDHLNLSERVGTQKDAKSLEGCFTQLGYETECLSDLTKVELDSTLERYAILDHSGFGSFVLCFMSHGDDGILYAKDEMFPSQDLFRWFYSSRCPSLEGKPKLFFLQSCRGAKLDSGGKEFAQEEKSPRSVVHPLEPHFLVSWSAPPGYSSWRSGGGAWFIQDLCDSFKATNAPKIEVIQLLKAATRKTCSRISDLSYKKCKFPKGKCDVTSCDACKSDKMATPSISSTLTKILCFRKVNSDTPSTPNSAVTKL